MAGRHIVRQGEHISSIASEYGFRNYLTIWDHPQNAELKQLRENPNVLLPGDEVFVPDKRKKEVTRPTDQLHRFRVVAPLLKLRLRLLDYLGVPYAATPCKLEVEGQNYELTTDADGKIEQDIPSSAKSGKLEIDGIQFELQIGYLDPADEDTGVHARLNNLGYYVDDIGMPDSELLQFSLELFQWDNKLPVSGQPDADSGDKIREMYGC